MDVSLLPNSIHCVWRSAIAFVHLKMAKQVATYIVYVVYTGRKKMTELLVYGRSIPEDRQMYTVHEVAAVLC
jgi:hypothetical protein